MPGHSSSSTSNISSHNNSTSNISSHNNNNNTRSLNINTLMRSLDKAIYQQVPLSTLLFTGVRLNSQTVKLAVQANRAEHKGSTQHI